jgi:hypothetical protein
VRGQVEEEDGNIFVYVRYASPGKRPKRLGRPVGGQVAKTIKQRCFKVRWGGSEGNLPKVWKFSLSLKTPTLEEIEVYI